ncbi:MAG: YraN family protein [Luteimonas sp.]
MATERRQRGDSVERAARDYLEQAGLRPVAANASYRVGELDLVMFDDHGGDGGTLVFVEVRYRRTNAFGGGAASIDTGKRHRILRAAQAFLAGHRQYAHCGCRFDVVDASGVPEAPELRWLKDAFRADDA